jgi:aspartoacylase
MNSTPFRPYDTVFVVGGTHGNERTGISLVRHWQQSPLEVQRQAFATELLLANPKAIENNTRFIDCDLNRSFSRDNLHRGQERLYEQDRARQIIALMGAGSAEKRTFAIDLHTTTTNMGITLITNTAPDNLAVAVAVQKQLPGVRIYCFAASDRIDTCLRAAADGGLGVEIGPIPQGVVRHGTLETTRHTVSIILDTLETFNRGAYVPPDPQTPIFLHDRHVHYPECPLNGPSVSIHPGIEGRDYERLEPGRPIFQSLSGQRHTYQGPGSRYPVFINEAAYYRENIAFSLTRKIPLADLASMG